MTSTTQTLPLSCPHCEAMLAEIAALSRSVITLTCTACGHGWSMSVAWLPDCILTMLGGRVSALTAWPSDTTSTGIGSALTQLREDENKSSGLLE